MENSKVTTSKERLEEIKILFDKQIELEKLKQKKTSAWKIVAYVFVGLAAFSFLAFSCYMMYKQSFTMETLLTVLLSFFSIGLSIMFYIQSDKSSSQYYSKSYDIMKEVSVALGKIESGFGEKLAHINSSLERFDNNKKEVEEKIEQSEKEQENLADKIAKEKSEEQRIALVKTLQEKTRETEMLKAKLLKMEKLEENARRENLVIREKLHNQENIISNLLNNSKVKGYFNNKPNFDNADDGIDDIF